MANKTKHKKKQPAKKQVVKKQISKKATSAPKPKALSQPAAAAKPTPASVSSKNTTPFFLAVGIVVTVVVIAFIANAMSKPSDIKDFSSHADEPLNVKVVGTDSDIANMAGSIPSTQAGQALQAPGAQGTTQAVPQEIQPSPATNLQATPNADTNALNVN
jgi:hypothetical protein